MNTVITEIAANITVQKINWLWKNWLPRGKLTILAGQPGSGKTTIALDLAAIVSAGRQFPDGTATSPGNILIWSGEDSASDVIVPRLLACHANLENCHIIRATVSDDGKRHPFDPAFDIEKLSKRVDEIGDVALLIIDPIINSVRGNSNQASDVRRDLQVVVDFAEKHGCAVLGITHFAKGSAGRSPQERILGSQSFVALARMTLATGVNEKTEKRVITRVKTNISPLGDGFEYELQQVNLGNEIEATAVSWGNEVIGSPCTILQNVEGVEGEEQGMINDAERFLHDMLSDAPLTAKKIQIEAKGAGFSQRTIERAKARLGVMSKKEGSSWVWTLP